MHPPLCYPAPCPLPGRSWTPCRLRLPTPPTSSAHPPPNSHPPPILRRSCWSLRLMWREGGRGQIYSYIPPNLQTCQLTAAPGVGLDCDPLNGGCCCCCHCRCRHCWRFLLPPPPTGRGAAGDRVAGPAATSQPWYCCPHSSHSTAPDPAGTVATLLTLQVACALVSQSAPATGSSPRGPGPPSTSTSGWA